MSQVQFSPLSIYKSIDRNERGVESSVLKAAMERGSIPSGGRQGHSVPFVPLVAVDPSGDGNDAEASN